MIVRHNEVIETHDTCIVSSKQLREEHDKLLATHNELVVKHDEIVVLNKSLVSSNKKLKLDYANLNMKYQELDLAFDAMDEELNAIKENGIKKNMTTSCDDVVEVSHPTTCDHTSPTCSKTNHDMEKELEKELQSMTKCMYNMIKGTNLHKEILFMQGTMIQMDLDPSPRLRKIVQSRRSSKHASPRKWAPIVNIVKLPDIIQGSVQFLIVLFQPCLLTTSHNSMNIISY